MKVLNLVTVKTPFFEDQVRNLNDIGVRTYNIEVPKFHIIEDKSIAKSVRSIKKLNEVSQNVDLVHANDGYVLPFALLQNNAPVVSSIVGYDLNGKYYGYLCSLMTVFADINITLNKKMKNTIKGEGKVIPYGVDLKKFENINEKKARAKVGWKKEKKHVLFPYDPERKVKRYNLAKEVVERANKATEEIVDLKVVNGVPHKKMPLYMNAADVLLITSRSEGGPVTVKEALSCNLPVVSTDVGDVQEVLDEVDYGIVSDKKNQLVSGIIDMIKSDKKVNVRKYVHKWGWKKTAKEIKGVYKRIA